MVSVTYANCLYRHVHLSHAKPLVDVGTSGRKSSGVEYIFPTLLLSRRRQPQPVQADPSQSDRMDA